jgi:uracil-DNA glycosylase
MGTGHATRAGARHVCRIDDHTVDLADHLMTPDTTKAAYELLAFYLEAGVDTPIGEEPIDRFADPAVVAPQRRADMVGAPAGTTGSVQRMPAPALHIAPAPPAPDTATLAAREAARNAANLEDLRAILDRFDGCALKATATQLVFADGNPQARLMFVGEAPGRDEDLAGKPFVGRSGKLLDRMMAAIGIDRTQAYIANIVPWRPPGNRTPTPQESQICLPFTLRQIELADPEILVCLGGPSAQTLLGIKDGIRKARGRWLTFQTGTREIRAVATFHPAYLLRSPLEKRLAWRDFLAIKAALAGPSG